MDRVILLAVFTLLGLGLVQVYSASYIFATESRGDGLFFFQRQAVFAIASFLILLAVAKVPWKWIERFTPWFWAGVVGLVFLTFVPGIGFRAGGAGRWIQFGDFRLEPSELLKVGLPLMFGWLLTRDFEGFGNWKWPARVLIFLLPLVALLKQPDFGSFALVTGTLVTLLFCFGLPRLFAVLGGIAAVPAFYFLVMTVPYRRARVEAFLDPWSDRAAGGFQVIQSMLSLYSGGITGRGLGESQGKLFFLPEAHTDFTLSIFGEEMGFVGVSAVLLIYLLLIYRGFKIALGTSSPSARATALGLSVVFSLQVFVNCGVAMGFLPTKGLTLPFLSYGGSSLLATALLFGILLNISRAAKYTGSSSRL